MSPQDYDAWYDSPRGRWIGEAEFQLLCRHLDLQPGQLLLDVGCGTGWFTRRLAQAGFTMTGLDLDESMLAVAREKSPSGTPGCRATPHGYLLPTAASTRSWR